MTSQAAASPPYPLYSTTFTLHRVSPLCVGNGTLLDNGSLAQYARHFRDILAGDVLRGVRVGLAPDDDTLSRVGSLGTVTWKILANEDEWEPRGENTQLEADESLMSIAGRRGILVQVRYEKAEYMAILLREIDGSGEQESILETEEDDEFEKFPLLLTRMPNSLRETFTGFLASTFDARVSNLHLDGEFLVEAFEKYLSDLSSEEESADVLLKKAVRDVQVSIGFNQPVGKVLSLKTIDVHIAGEDIPAMVARGKRSTHDTNRPFMNALNAFVDAHLAMDLKHDQVKLLRIACAAFVLGSEGKVKLTRPINDDEDGQWRATQLLVTRLIQRARGQGPLQYST
ncbi:kinetochore complex Sim4 subunit Fta1-domain-containing protein [Xylogone sp. PMI_703]|nr:kinetochore complex Sim4 subunit Fta1-domain-containing protein [Xylogone sp. PMI_703]